VAEGVVDFLEMVEIDKQQCQRQACFVIDRVDGQPFGINFTAKQLEL